MKRIYANKCWISIASQLLIGETCEIQVWFTTFFLYLSFFSFFNLFWIWFYRWRCCVFSLLFKKKLCVSVLWVSDCVRVCAMHMRIHELDWIFIKWIWICAHWWIWTHNWKHRKYCIQNHNVAKLSQPDTRFKWKENYVGHRSFAHPIGIR